MACAPRLPVQLTSTLEQLQLIFKVPETISEVQAEMKSERPNWLLIHKRCVPWNRSQCHGEMFGTARPAPFLLCHQDHRAGGMQVPRAQPHGLLFRGHRLCQARSEPVLCRRGRRRGKAMD